MNHKGIQYTIAPTIDPDVWKWQFRIGETVKTGKTKTRLAAMAARRVQLKIDTVLKNSDTDARQGADFFELP